MTVTPSVLWALLTVLQRELDGAETIEAVAALLRKLARESR